MCSYRRTPRSASPTHPSMRTYMTHGPFRACDPPFGPALGRLVFLARSSRRVTKCEKVQRWRRLFRLVRAGPAVQLGQMNASSGRVCCWSRNTQGEAEDVTSKRPAIGANQGASKGQGDAGAAGDSTLIQLKCFNPFRSAQQQEGVLGPHAAARSWPDGRAVRGNPSSPPDEGSRGHRSRAAVQCRWSGG